MKIGFPEGTRNSIWTASETNGSKLFTNSLQYSKRHLPKFVGVKQPGLHYMAQCLYCSDIPETGLKLGLRISLCWLHLVGPWEHTHACSFLSTSFDLAFLLRLFTFLRSQSIFPCLRLLYVLWIVLVIFNKTANGFLLYCSQSICYTVHVLQSHKLGF
jgi:hypothetical protein